MAEKRFHGLRDKAISAKFNPDRKASYHEASETWEKIRQACIDDPNVPLWMFDALYALNRLNEIVYKWEVARSSFETAQDWLLDAMDNIPKEPDE